MKLKGLNKSSFENKQILNKINQIFRKERGSLFKIPQPNEPVILLISGGLDSISLWYLLLEKFHLNVFPLHITHHSSGGKSIPFFSNYFKKNYPSIFHSVFYFNSSNIFTFSNKIIKNIIYDKDLLFKNINTSPHGNFIHAFFMTNPTRLANYATLGYEYSLLLKYQNNIKPTTIITGITSADSYLSSNSTLTLHRTINLSLCLMMNDYNIQFTPWIMEKNTFMKKTKLISFAKKHLFPIEKTWSCTHNFYYQCGICMNCKARRFVFHKIGFKDNTTYLIDIPFVKTISNKFRK